MPQTINALWNGEIFPLESFGRSNTEMRTLEALMGRHFEALRQSANTEQSAILEKYHSNIAEYVGICSEQGFYDGFCFGMKLAAEAFYSK